MKTFRNAKLCYVGVIIRHCGEGVWMCACMCASVYVCAKSQTNKVIMLIREMLPLAVTLHTSRATALFSSTLSLTPFAFLSLSLPHFLLSLFSSSNPPQRVCVRARACVWVLSVAAGAAMPPPESLVAGLKEDTNYRGRIEKEKGRWFVVLRKRENIHRHTKSSLCMSIIYQPRLNPWVSSVWFCAFFLSFLIVFLCMSNKTQLSNVCLTCGVLLLCRSKIQNFINTLHTVQC